MRILRPAIRANGGRAAAAQADYTNRLMEYIPVAVSGVYPVLDNGLRAYAAEPLSNLIKTWQLGGLVFAVLVLVVLLDLHRSYNRAGLHGPVRKRMQTLQSVIAVFAFLIWTYALKGSLWGDLHNAALAMILVILFLILAQYVPSIKPEEAKESGFSDMKS